MGEPLAQIVRLVRVEVAVVMEARWAKHRTVGRIATFCRFHLSRLALRQSFSSTMRCSASSAQAAGISSRASRGRVD
jgi:hypothetical protein